MVKKIMTINDIFDDEVPTQSNKNSIFDTITVKDFYINEFVDYASYSTIRMIGSVIDGMKNSHRKIICTVLDKKIKNDIKVSQLNSLVATYTEYLHGDCSGVISGMAQFYAGSNNLPLLAAEGNFGNRFKNAPSAPRYIFTYGKSILFDLINKEDDNIIEFQYFEGNRIEPKYYLPSLPLLIINGSSGISSGFKQSILPRDPKTVKKYLEKRLQTKGTKPTSQFKPSFNGFNGSVIKGDKTNQWKIVGTIKRVNTTTVDITEIPVGVELSKYISILDTLKDNDFIKSYKDLSDKNTFKFTLKFQRNVLSNLTDEELLDKLKLVKIETEIYTTLDENGKIKIFKTVQDMFDYYYDFKLLKLKERKQYLIGKYKKDIEIDNSKYIFIKSIIDGKLVINKRPIADIEKDLNTIKGIIKIDDNYNYLLNMGIGNLTKDNMDKLNKRIKDKKQQLKDLKQKSVEDLWLDELSKLKL